MERIRPQDLPEATPRLPPGLIRQSATTLPRPASLNELKEGARVVEAAVVEVIAVHMPPRPYRQTPMYHRGHGVWLSDAVQSQAVLVSTFDWLEDAQTIYVLPAHLSRQLAARDPNVGTATFRSLDSVTMGGLDTRWLQTHQSELIEVRRHQGTRHRNLVALVSTPPGGLSAPARALTIFDTNNALPLQAYGFSHFAGAALVPTHLIMAASENESLAFYLQNTFAAILGAPIVSPDGQLIALNALRDPAKPEISLAVPSAAITAFLQSLATTKP